MTKERLKKYRTIKREALKIKQEMEQLSQTVCTLQTQNLKAENLKGLLDRLMAVYWAKMEELAAEQLEIEQAIDQLPPTQRIILRDYYIRGVTWEEVCRNNPYEWAQVHRIHASALKELEVG